MTDVSGHYCNQTRPDNLHDSIDGHLKFAFDHLVDLFLGVEVLVNGCPAHEVVVCKGHTGRMEITTAPSGQALDDPKIYRIDEGYTTSLCGNSTPLSSIALPRN